MRLFPAFLGVGRIGPRAAQRYRSEMIRQKDTGLDQAVVVLVADDPIPHRGHIPSVGMKGRVQGRAKLLPDLI
jgi:hypothetical protein